MYKLRSVGDMPVMTNAPCGTKMNERTGGEKNFGIINSCI
jgi:hypothetical protein